MKSKFKKRAKKNPDMVLQITSMADIFTILLVFLLKTLSTGASNVSIERNLVLPEASKSEGIVDSVKVEISDNGVALDDKLITPLQHFKADSQDLTEDGTSRSLTTALTNQRQRDTSQRYARLLILADQATPFSTVRSVLASASASGFIDYKLVVVEDK
jgi:biopolymer transport protein ExbD